MNQNSRTYPAGNVVLDNSWENYWVASPIKSGRGLQQFGQMISLADDFPTCMAKRTYADVCRKKASEIDQNTVKAIAEAFVSSGYKIKTLFEQSAIRQDCLGE